MKVIIVGGVAAGAGAAARLRRLSEDCEILLLEKGDFISYANCGLPYHLGGVIADRENLLVMPPARFAAWLDVDVRLRHEVTAIDPAKKVVTVRTPEGVREESYDKLLLATGAEPRSGAPHGEGRVLHLWTMADMDRIAAKLAGAKRAVIVGGGFIGLETAENLRHRGLTVTLLQRSGHVLPTFDAEMAQPLAAELRSLGVDLRFGASVAAYEVDEMVSLVRTFGRKVGVQRDNVAIQRFLVRGALEIFLALRSRRIAENGLHSECFGILRDSRSDFANTNYADGQALQSLLVPDGVQKQYGRHPLRHGNGVGASGGGPGDAVGFQRFFVQVLAAGGGGGDEFHFGGELKELLVDLRDGAHADDVGVPYNGSIERPATESSGDAN